MKLLKNKIFIAVICLLLAVAISALMNRQQKNTAETVEVVQAVSLIAENTQITENMLKTNEIIKADLPDGAITDKSEIVGKFTTTAIYPQDYIISSKLSDVTTENGLYALGNGEYAISLSVSKLAESVSGVLLPGDAVMLYCYNTDSKTLSARSGMEVYEVLSCTNSKGVDIREAKAEGTSSDSAVPSTVTVKASLDQAAWLANAEQSGSIHVVFAARGEKAAQLLGKTAGE